MPIDVAQAEMAAANRYRRSVSGDGGSKSLSLSMKHGEDGGSKSTKMESIPISIPIPISILMKPIQIDGVLGFTATNPVVRLAPKLRRGKWWVG